MTGEGAGKAKRWRASVQLDLLSRNSKAGVPDKSKVKAVCVLVQGWFSFGSLDLKGPEHRNNEYPSNLEGEMVSWTNTAAKTEYEVPWV